MDAGLHPRAGRRGREIQVGVCDGPETAPAPVASRLSTSLLQSSVCIQARFAALLCARSRRAETDVGSAGQPTGFSAQEVPGDKFFLVQVYQAWPTFPGRKPWQARERIHQE